MITISALLASEGGKQQWGSGAERTHCCAERWAVVAGPGFLACAEGRGPPD